MAERDETRTDPTEPAAAAETPLAGDATAPKPSRVRGRAAAGGDEPGALKAENDALRRENEELRRKAGQPAGVGAGPADEPPEWLRRTDLPLWECWMEKDPSIRRTRVRAADEANAEKAFLKAIGGIATENPITAVQVDEEAEAAEREAGGDDTDKRKAPRARAKKK